MKFETFEDAHAALDNRPLTEGQANGIRDYVEHNIIPAFDPCLGCEPNAIRSLIAELQMVERELEARKDFADEGYIAGAEDVAGLKPETAEKYGLDYPKIEDITLADVDTTVTEVVPEVVEEKPKAAPRKRAAKKVE